MKTTQSWLRPSSWVIRDKVTKEAKLEFFNIDLIGKVNTEKYEVVSILEHLQSIKKETE